MEIEEESGKATAKEKMFSVTVKGVDADENPTSEVK